MDIINRKKDLKTLPGLFKKRSANGIISEEQFHRILKIERERSDRSQHQFSLILFELRQFKKNDALNPSVLAKIISRVREIDEIGWYDKNHIGVILPYTTGDGAHKLIESIGSSVDQIFSHSAVSVYTYPSK